MTIDGKGYTVDGTARGGAAGIVVSSGASRVTIKNVRLTDWAYAVYYRPARATAASKGAPSSRTSWAGVVVYTGAPGYTVTGNRVTGIGYAIFVGGGDRQHDLQQPVLAPA